MSQIDFNNRAGKPIVVVGSLNMDLVMRTPRVPQAGETMFGHEFATLPGGKGANQAVACARLGAQVIMIGQVGQDGFGQTLRDGLRSDGIDVSHLGRSAAQTGVAMILVEDIGENRIILAPGANATLSTTDIDKAAEVIASAAMLVVQLEVPLPVVEYAMRMARKAGVPVLLNPAPACTLGDEFLRQVDVLVPNETEAALLAGREVTDVASAMSVARQLRERGPSCVLLTLGDKGVVIADTLGERHIEAQKVQAVDTTAAGDTFIGGVCSGLVEGMSIDAAATLGQRASAICVTRHGAQPAIPYRRELEI